MIRHKIGWVLMATIALGADARAQAEPYSGETEPGVPFPLPQAKAFGRRAGEGESNALTFSWDGRLMMYFDSGHLDENGAPLWAGHMPAQNAYPWGYVFAAFDPGRIALDAQNRPDFAPAIGAPLARFATVAYDAPPDTTGLNNYPSYAPPGHTVQHYPHIAGTMGELGLRACDFLSNNMYPVPVDQLPAGTDNQNPYPSNEKGTPEEFGSYRTYRAYVTFQDLPRFWDGSLWYGYTIPVIGSPFFTDFGLYPPGTYPNGLSIDASHGPEVMKRNGIAQLEITTDPAANTVVRVEVIEKWKPFTIAGGDTLFPDRPGMASVVGLGVPTTSTMYADNFEPILTHDGHLMVGKGSPALIYGIGASRAVFYYNDTAFSDTGWRGPFELTQLHSKNAIALGPEQLTIAERYPISRHPFKDYAGNPLTSTDPFEGGYTWLDPDGRFLIYSVASGGVGDGAHPWNLNGHPECWLNSDGGGSSNRAHASIVGSVTGWQMWRIDHEAENPSRHMFTAWDQDSRTTHLRVASLGFSPGFWNVLRGAQGLPLRDDGRMKLQLINSNRLLYYELDLSPYQERDYGFYLPMTEMLILQPGDERHVDLSRTPDLSGNGHFATVHGGQLPCEYFELPSDTYWVDGLYLAAATPSGIHSGWTAADTVPGRVSGFWAKLADWKDGKDSDRDPNHTIDTQPFAGRGNQHDMDSDACWGRVGEAMFFKNATKVTVSNAGSPSELNPGVAGNARGFTASLWVNPRQERTGDTVLFQHNFTIALRPDATITASLGGQTIRASIPAPDLTWTHVAFTWKDTSAPSSSEMALYINGDPAGTATLTVDDLTPSSADIDIGCLAACASDPTRAVVLLDEVALKNSALIGQDVVDLALGPIPTKTWDNSNLPAGPAPFVDATDARVPVGNAYHSGVAALGADLFRDVQLSGRKTMSCASCHDTGNAFVDGLSTPSNNIRNTPTLYNQRYQIEQLWDAHAADLEDQVLRPILSPTEMGNSLSALTALLNTSEYQMQFSAVFSSGPFGVDHLKMALATYERSLTAGDAPADRYSAGDPAALSPSAKAGRGLFFGKARCSGCHNGPNFTDGRLWTTGDFRSDGFDDGAAKATAGASTAGRARFQGAFKTPTLRELSRTGPYFHDGRAKTLREVIDFYEAGGVRQDSTDPGFALLDAGHDIVAEEINRRLGLTHGEQVDLEAYLLALSAEFGGTVDDGPTGNNQAPVVAVSGVRFDAATGMVTVVATIRDLVDGPGDLDTTMEWTLDLELPLGGRHYVWSDASSITPITNGYEVTITKPGPMTGQLRIRAADHHGLWSAWLQMSY